MQFQAKANVYTADGKKAGAVERVVIDPRNNQVTHIIVKKGLLFPSDKVIPVDMVAMADADRVTLTAEAGDPASLPDFTEEHYVPLAGVNWVEPPLSGGMASPQVAGAMTAPLLFYPPAAALPSSHLATELGGTPAPYAPTGTRQMEVDRNIPEDTVPLKEGAKVVAADGHQVGHVERVFTNTQTNEVTHLLVSKGLFLKERKVVPMAWVLDVGEKEVRLAVGSDLLQGLRGFND